MKTKPLGILLILAVLLLFLSAGADVLAQTSTGFNLEWHVIGNGGGESSSGSYRVNGTIGQSLASQPSSSSASFRVSSGYWFVNTGVNLYLPTILKN